MLVGGNRSGSDEFAGMKRTNRACDGTNPIILPTVDPPIPPSQVNCLGKFSEHILLADGLLFLFGKVYFLLKFLINETCEL